MMLADPGRVHAELVGVERLGGDVGDELVGVARVVLVVIVAQREVAEFHGALLRCRRLVTAAPVSDTNNAFAIVVNASVWSTLGRDIYVSVAVLTQRPEPAVAPRPHLDLDNYLPYLINRVGVALVAATYTAETLAPHGLSLAMWRVLAALSNNGEQRQIDLVDMTSIDASTMSRLVTRLVRIGLVTRAARRPSSREVVVALSPKGRAQVESLIPIAKSLEKIASAGLSAKEQAVVKRALRRMYANLTDGRRK